MTKIVRYALIITAVLALTISVACKKSSTPTVEQVTSGAEAGAKAGADAGMSAAKSGGVKEGVKEGGMEGGKAAAEEIVQ